jgi:hypothetical protein
VTVEILNINDSGVLVAPTPEEAPGIVHAIREVCRARGLRIYDLMLEEQDGKRIVDIRFIDDLDTESAWDFAKALKRYSTAPPQFMVTIENHGRLKIEPMRFFTGERAEFEARAYVASIPRSEGLAVMYEVGHNGPPTKVQGIYQGRATRGT